MKTQLFCGVFCSLMFLLAVGSLSGNILKAHAQETRPAVIVNFDVSVDPGSSGFVSRAVSYAIQQHASAIVFEMNTPGGLLSDMQSIIDSINDSQQSGIPCYTFVVSDGWAASAGSYIAMATNKIFMAPGSAIGSSTPIVVGGTDLEQNHTETFMLSYMEGFATEWERNVTAAQDMVLQDEAYSWVEALDNHVADGSVSSLNEVLSDVGLTGAPQVNFSESFYDQFISALSNSILDGILILLGIIAIVLDFYHPTIILSIAGIVVIVLGLIGAEVIGASVLGYVILAIAAVLIALELKLGHGFAMMAGVAIGAFGIYYLAQGLNYSPSPITDVTELELFLVIVAGVVAGLYSRWMIGPIRHRGKLTGPEAIIGKIGTAVTDLKPDGEVRVGGIVWRAKSIQGDIQKGDSVRVKSLEDLVLKVEKADAEPATQTKK
jgi:membrane-bound serine protease (ClpP class)